MGPKTFGSSKASWKRHNTHSEGGLSHDKSSRTFGGAFDIEGHGYGNSSLEQKRKLPPRDQKKMESWIKAKQKMSEAEFQQRI
jgi:hypothetical protein